jgi:APA family basic amino acid/polyamine antiporter
MAFGEYVQGVFPEAPPLILGLAAAWLVTLVHLSGVRHGSTFQIVSTLIKVLLILAFIIAGFATATPQAISFLPTSADLGYMASAPFAISLVFVMYSYSGWNAATYIAGEVRDPSRTLPYALVAATVIVSVLYVALNAVFLYTTPMSELAGQLNVAQIAGQHIFGTTGANIVALLICVGLISAISAMMWIGPRVTMAMGEDFPMLAVFSRKSDTGVPVPALLFQVAVVTLLLLTQSFEAVLEFIQFSLTLCSFLAVLGVVVLRVQQPALKRPYRMWGYPMTPFIFLAVTAIMLFYLMVERPVQSLASLALMLSGLAVYAVSKSGALTGREVSSTSKG